MMAKAQPTRFGESFWTQMVVTVGLVILTAITVWGQVKAAQRASDAAAKVESVKTTLAASTAETADKLEGLEATANKTHALVNSAYGVQLKLVAVSQRRIAVLTKDPADIQAATAAEKLSADHDASQK